MPPALGPAAPRTQEGVTVSKKLTTNVHVADENGQTHAFGPGDDVPDWAEKAISNPDVWEGAESSDPARVSDPGNSGSVAAAVDGVEDPKPRYELEAEERDAEQKSSERSPRASDGPADAGEEPRQRRRG